ncbi:prevent-host-death protein [Streptococcus dysgalactiae subsp. equisimilis]|nr:prevent-host-death protein [Streptococcus dysgalactiae subsp. equisimilis]
MKHFNIAEFNRGQSSKILRGLVSDDDVGFINKNGKPMAIVISNERFERLLENGIDINEY